MSHPRRFRLPLPSTSRHPLTLLLAGLLVALPVAARAAPAASPGPAASSAPAAPSASPAPDASVAPSPGASPATSPSVVPDPRSTPAAHKPRVTRPARPVFAGPGSHPVVALTFDDGWDAGRCLDIAQELEALGVPATFFPNGMRVRDAPAVWRRIAERFPIANHTMHHPFLTSGPAATVTREIAVDERVIERVTGRPMVKLFRPTYGAWDQRLARIAASLGYPQLILWDTSGGDTGAHATDHGVARAALRGKAGAIVLMHCGPEVTPRIVPLVVARYACAGYRFGTLSEVLADGPGVAPDVACPAPVVPKPGKHVTTDATIGTLPHLWSDTGGPWGPPADGTALPAGVTGAWRITAVRPSGRGVEPGPATAGGVPSDLVRLEPDGWLWVRWGTWIAALPGCVLAGGSGTTGPRVVSGCTDGAGADLVASLRESATAHAVEPLLWMADRSGRLVLAAVRPGAAPPTVVTGRP